ncbi:sugar transporter SWEET1 [Drosophila guanche]|uniref:Sugar transporter SWEET n=1 Tax=Drosophila guanche TaxID=7266 RepID=A0A3B0J5Q6_DROGU|nr:sugar transporter SWEET1 [Drosophila guanche]SPP75153.1 blast:Sugar transporter SWEET1 [Drosophila guanche]
MSAVAYELLSTTAVISTVFQFLSGAMICRKYIQKKSTGDSSGVPFICGFLSCSFWLRYGVLTEEQSIVLVNVIGSTLFLIYTLIYYVFTINKRAFVKQFAFVLAVLIGVIIYTNRLEDQRNQMIHITGIFCCIVTVCFFAAPLASLLHVIRAKNSESLPLPLIATSFLVSLQWLIYGILISDSFIQIPNFLGCLLSMMQLSLFVVYPPRSYSGQGYKLVEQAVPF